MAIINSVLGPLDTANLGFTLMHEHIFGAGAGITQNYPGLMEKDYMKYIVDGLKETKAAGIDSIVDATTLDLGRDVNILAEASRQSGVNIVACTGWWLIVPRFIAGNTPDQWADAFVREIREGIAGTDIKAGILKGASDMTGVTKEEEIILRAVARAHHQTGVPIMLHSYSPGQVGRRQIEVLKEEGVDMGRVKMDHSNDTTDVEYLVWMLEQGCYLGLDRYPGQGVSPESRTKTLKALIDAGYKDRLCPSHDWSLTRVQADGLRPLWSRADREKWNPHAFLYIKKVVFPQLREMGVDEETINGLFVNNSRRFFEGG
ncbi:phosphotriesterase [Chloroflexota bacterium]